MKIEEQFVTGETNKLVWYQLYQVSTCSTAVVAVRIFLNIGSSAGVMQYSFS